ncbi:MAG: transglycosylase SLT domain-containing protein [Nitrospinota bacterium]|nr:transglycosylase SLT domain-containing protein [Nitrospinota bacterium]
MKRLILAVLVSVTLEVFNVSIYLIKKLKHFLLLVIVLSITSPSSASAFCFKKAGEMYDIDPAFLKAIAVTESSLDPNAVRCDEDGFNCDRSLMQINDQWADLAPDEYEQAMSSPCDNVLFGTKILSECLEKYGRTPRGTGCYNVGYITTKGKERAAMRYALRVYRNYGILQGG